MQEVYTTTVTDLGDNFKDFISTKMMVLFMDNAPDELLDYCILHGENELKTDIQVGDILKINEKEYEITALGDVVNENLDKLGHITLKFDGSTTADLSGSLYLEEKEMPEIKIGDKIKVVRK